MRIGVLAATTPGVVTINTDYPAYNPNLNITTPGQGINPALVPPAPANVTTYGVDTAGDTLVCPPGFPYDSTLKDCKGYTGSPVDVAAMALQASMDVCTSGGGTWDQINNVCVPAQAPASTQLITGIDNTVLYAAGGLLLLMIFMGGRR